jgi:hypothetical protein
MGADYSAYLVVGVMFEDVMEERLIKTEFKKFNEDTGKPYTKVEENVKYFLGGIEFVDRGELVEKVENFGLGFFYGDYEQKEDWILGNKIAAIRDCGVVPINIDHIVFNTVKEELIKIGINAEPKLFLVLDCSY